MDYQEIAQAEIIANDVTLCLECNNGLSHSRGWAFADTRTIHYSPKCATRGTLYGLLHEVGHIILGHGKTCKLRRYEMEMQAEDYARDSFRKLGIAIPRSKVALGNAYVARRKRTGDKIRKARRAK